MIPLNIFIRSTGSITPHYSGEIEYGDYIDPKMMRRMSRIIKMGVVAAMECLKKSGLSMPSALITATAYGCLEDSDQFLRRMIEFGEKMLSPTAFIQSTHNTVGAQIALLLKCHNYNNTIVHRAFSFENALIESALLLTENFDSVLTGAVDENTTDLQTILSRFGLYKSPTAIPGEGAWFFLLGKSEDPDCIAKLRSVKTYYGELGESDYNSFLLDFLNDSELPPDGIDYILLADRVESNKVKLRNQFPEIPVLSFRELSGDTPTLSGFGLWLATEIISGQYKIQEIRHSKFPVKNILIHTQNDRLHHSLMLVSAC